MILSNLKDNLPVESNIDYILDDIPYSFELRGGSFKILSYHSLGTSRIDNYH